jgi:Trp operon repressor
MQNQLNELLQKEMSRKEFIATLGFGVASIFGLSTLLKIFTGKKSVVGYGSSSYGGNR